MINLSMRSRLLSLVLLAALPIDTTMIICHLLCCNTTIQNNFKECLNNGSSLPLICICPFKRLAYVQYITLSGDYHWPLCFNVVAVWRAAIFSTTLHVDIYWSYKQDFGCRPAPGHRQENHISNDFITLLKAIFIVIIWTWLCLCSDFPLLVMPYKSSQVKSIFMPFHSISYYHLLPFNAELY